MKKILAISIVALIALAVLVMGGILYAQTAGDIPLMGKLQKGFVDPNNGVLDSWNVDYDGSATLPSGARTSNTVWHHLRTLAARSGTQVTAGGSFPATNIDGNIFMADTDFTVSGGVAQDASGADVTQIEQGDVYRYNASNSHWITVSGYAYIDNDVILERMLHIQGNPAVGECLSWDGVDLEWSTCATGPVTVADGSVTTDKLHDGAATTAKLGDASVTTLKLVDGSVTEPKLAMYNRPANGEVIEWDQTANRMQWSPVDSLSLADDSITEPKLVIAGTTTNAYAIVWDASAGGMRWATAGTDTVANNAITEPKLAMQNNPSDGHVIEWDQVSSQMQWTSVSNVSLADGGVTTTKLADGSVTEPKLAITTNPQQGYVIEWNSGAMQWGTVGSATIGADSISTGNIVDGQVTNPDIGGGAVTEAKIANGSVTEPKLAIAADPADGQFMKWNNSAMEWAAITTGTPNPDSITSAMIIDGAIESEDLKDGAVTDAKIASRTITEDRLVLGGTLDNGYAILWDTSGSAGAMEWGQIVEDSVEDDAIPEVKLKIGNIPSDGYVLTWDETVTPNIMKWSTAGSASITDGSVTELKLGIENNPTNGYALLWDGSASTPTMEWATVGTTTLADDAVDGTKLAGDSVTSSHIVDGAVAESDLAITNTATSSSLTGFQLTWAGSAMSWKAAYENVIRLVTTLPSSAADIIAAGEAELIGKISSGGDAIDALYFKAESKDLSIRMDDITDRTFLNNLLIGYSNVARNGLYKKGGAIHPSLPDGFVNLIEGILDGSNRVLQMKWNAVSDRPGFGTDTVYVSSGLSGASRVALTKDSGSTNTWTSGHLSGTRIFPTAHDIYTVSFWDSLTGGNEYVPTSRAADYLARVVDEQHLLESDGKIIERINDVYTLTAHGSYRGDFDATRGGYAEGDMVTAKGSAATGADEVIFIAVQDIVKGTGDLTFPHADRGNWVEISNGFEEYLYGTPFEPGVLIPQDRWTSHTLTRALTEHDDDRSIILEFEHTHTNAGTNTTNENDVFTFVEIGPVDRWRTFDAKTHNGSGVYLDQTLANSMCGRIPNFKIGVPATFSNVSSDQDDVLICIARGATTDIMLIFASEQLHTVNTYIVLR